MKQQLVSKDAPPSMDLEAFNVYTHMGEVLLNAVEGLCHRLAEPASADPVSLTDPVEVQQFMERTEKTLHDISSVVRELSAAVRRIDRWTMDAYGRLQQFEKRIQERESRESQAYQRFSREETRERALAAAQELQENDEAMTLAKVARKANLKYGQIMYAFGNKQKFLAALEESSVRKSA